VLGALKVEVGLTGAKVIVSELDIVNDDDGCACVVERVAVDECGGKNVALVDVDGLKLVKPRELTIGEADDERFADVINVSVGVVEGKGGIQDETRDGVKLVEEDRSSAEVDAEIASLVDEIDDDEVIIADGVAEMHRGIDCVPSAFDKMDELSTPTDLLLCDTTLFHLVVLDPVADRVSLRLLGQQL